MTPSHANKAGRRYRYYVSSALQQGRADEAGSVARVSATDIEEVILQALRQRWPGEPDDRLLIEQHLVRAVLRPSTIELTLHSPSSAELGGNDNLFAIAPQDCSDAPGLDVDRSKGSFDVIILPWSRPSSSRRSEIIRLANIPEDPRPIRADRRATLVRAIALGRRWLAEIAAGEVASPNAIALREGCSKRHVTMTTSLALLSPALVQAAVEGRLPRGTGLKALTDPSLIWLQQHQGLGI